MPSSELDGESECARSMSRATAPFSAKLTMQPSRCIMRPIRRRVRASSSTTRTRSYEKERFSAEGNVKYRAELTGPSSNSKACDRAAGTGAAGGGSAGGAEEDERFSFLEGTEGLLRRSAPPCAVVSAESPSLGVLDSGGVMPSMGVKEACPCRAGE